MESLVVVGPLLAAVAASVAFLVAVPDPHARTHFHRVLLGAAAFTVGGLLLLGIPGALLMVATLPPVAILQEVLGTTPASMADAAWPAALVLTGLWPACAVVAYTVAFGAMRRAARRVQLAVLVGIAYAAGIALTYYGMAVQF